MPTIRPLRGRALLRRHETEHGEYALPSGIIVPANVDPDRGVGDQQFYSRDGNDRPAKRIHRGIVVALGPPAFVHDKTADAATVPWHVEIGQEVWYVYALALEKVRRWEDHVVVGQAEVQAVTA